MSDNWVVQNLENALETWNEKLAEIWQLLTQSPEEFKGGAIWNVIVGIHGAVQAIGLALLVLFFVVGVMKTCGSFADLKRPEHPATRNRAEALYPVRSGQRRGNLRAGADDGAFSDRAGSHLHDHGLRRPRCRAGNSLAAGDHNRGGRLRLF